MNNLKGPRGVLLEIIRPGVMCQHQRENDYWLVHEKVKLTKGNQTILRILLKKMTDPTKTDTVSLTRFVKLYKIMSIPDGCPYET